MHPAKPSFLYIYIKSHMSGDSSARLSTVSTARSAFFFLESKATVTQFFNFNSVSPIETADLIRTVTSRALTERAYHIPCLAIVTKLIAFFIRNVQWFVIIYSPILTSAVYLTALAHNAISVSIVTALATVTLYPALGVARPAFMPFAGIIAVIRANRTNGITLLISVSGGVRCTIRSRRIRIGALVIICVVRIIGARIIFRTVCAERIFRPTHHTRKRGSAFTAKFRIRIVLMSTSRTDFLGVQLCTAVPAKCATFRLRLITRRTRNHRFFRTAARNRHKYR